MNHERSTRHPLAAQAEPEAERYNAYSEYTGGPIEIAKRLAAVINTAPFTMWSEAEAGELGEEIAILAPDMARSARANRLAVAFGQAAACGMPRGTRIRILTEWCGAVLPALASDPSARVLSETIAAARLVAAAPDPQTIPGIDDTLADLDHRNDNRSPLHGLNDWARHELEFVVDPEHRPAACAPGYEPWWRATDILGSIEAVLGDDAAEAAFAQCEEILAEHLYPWRRPAEALLKLPSSFMQADDDWRELAAEQVAFQRYAEAALAEAGDDDVAQARVLGAVADALVESDLNAYADGAARTRALLRELRLDGRPMPEVIASYRRTLAGLDADCTSAPDCAHCAAERANEDRFLTAFEQNYVVHYTLGEGDRPAHERLAEILSAFEYALGETGARVFGAALEALRGGKR